MLNDRCPHCGYCPHCGRSNHGNYAYPYWYSQPYYHTPYWTVGGPIGAGAGLGSGSPQGVSNVGALGVLGQNDISGAAQSPPSFTVTLGGDLAAG